MLCAAALGTTLYFLGAFAPARLHLEQGIALTGMGFQALPADNVICPIEHMPLSGRCSWKAIMIERHVNPSSET